MDNINDIIGSLSEDDIASLKSAAQAMFGGNPDINLDDLLNSSQKSEQEKHHGGEKTEDSPFDFASAFTPEMFAKISTIMGSIGKKDSRYDLISALKPHLSENKRKRADEALQMLKLFEILPLLQDGFNSKK